MLSEKAKFVISRLCEHGYKAYAVGGCVRDILRGTAPQDFDITTSALPHEIKQVFSRFTTVDTGIAHGTVTVVLDKEPFEITTFRTDGEYIDSRHPESVTFTKNVEDDLSRRDFTVNSMAMDKDGSLVDPFGGREDIEKKIIRCTGDADTRFSEDALRIMRALRFSSVLGFEIERETADAIVRKKDLLLNISSERIFAELKKLLCGKDVFRVLTEFSEVICTVIPELAPSVGFDQRNKYHIYNIYEHIAHSVAAIEPDPALRLTMLFHDIGKPYMCTEDGDGVRHFKGHPALSSEMAGEILNRLRCDSATKRRVCLLSKLHDRDIMPSKRAVKRLFLRLSYDEIIMLCKVRLADNAAQNPAYNGRSIEAAEIMALAEKIYKSGECVSLSSLAVNGHDMAALGYKGAEIGEILKLLLIKVIDGDLPNTRDELVTFAKGLYGETF